MHTDEGARGPRTLGVSGAAKYYGVSIKTFRDRFMPSILTVDVSAPNAKRRRRIFSLEALDETLRQLQKKPTE